MHYAPRTLLATASLSATQYDKVLFVFFLLFFFVFRAFPQISH